MEKERPCDGLKNEFTRKTEKQHQQSDQFKMNVFRKLILGCLQIDSRDDIPSTEALAMAGVDYNVVQVRIVDQPWIWRLQKIFKRIWPFRKKNKVGDYERQSEKRSIIKAKGRRSRLKVAMENQKTVKSNANKGSNKRKIVL